MIGEGFYQGRAAARARLSVVRVSPAIWISVARTDYAEKYLSDEEGGTLLHRRVDLCFATTPATMSEPSLATVGISIAVYSLCSGSMLLVNKLTLHW